MTMDVNDTDTASESEGEDFVVLVCPHCSTELETDVETATTPAQPISCPQCGNIFTPAQSKQSQHISSSGVTVPYISKTANHEKIGFVKEKCPSCGAALHHGDVICVGCGLNFRTGKNVAEANPSSIPAKLRNVKGNLKAIFLGLLGKK